MRSVQLLAVLSIVSMSCLPLMALPFGIRAEVAIFVLHPDLMESSIDAVVAAEGRLIDIAGGRFLMARSDRAGFASRLRSAGVWLMVPIFDAGCGGRDAAVAS